ncbi:hypothetical protein FHL15_009665 [Xylaria flabelliformis]|uniref:Uncharacterized protein n=1 Tax=Xylaria flabelliformis TaxID=2512241 RepID=A0A553HNJ0_9PEZI|nr:hypothetical protein FHL15_009665 [Xylaria flabelliformis]
MAGISSSTTHTSLDGPSHSEAGPVSISTVISHYRMRGHHPISTWRIGLISSSIMAGLAVLVMIIEAAKYYIRRRRRREEERNLTGLELHNMRQRPVAPRHDHDDGTTPPPAYSGPPRRTRHGSSVAEPESTSPPPRTDPQRPTAGVNGREVDDSEPAHK